MMSDAAQEQPMFNMDKIYVKDISLEIPHAPQIFLEREVPQIEVQLHTAATALDEGVFEVTVTATVTAKIAEKVMFLIEAKQAGIFTLRISRQRKKSRYWR
jgi:preprotein translocase subunit SecB